MPAPMSAPIHPPVDVLTAAIELAIPRFAAPIEAGVDPVAFRIESLGGELAPGHVGATRGAIEVPIHAVTAIVEALLDAVATFVRTISRIRKCLRAADQPRQAHQ